MDILKYLVNEMGLPEELSLNALLITKNNQEAAIDLVLNHPEKCKEAKIEQPGLSASKNKRIGSAKIEDLFVNPSKALKNLSDEEKLYVNPDYGFLVMVMAYLRRRIPSLNDYCVICDKPHVFAGNMLKPAVCSRELCCWSFQQLGVRADAADDIATEAEVVDLLVCMASCAVKNSARRELIFDPFPVVFDPHDKSKKILDPDNKDFALVQNLLNSMPSVEQMTQAVDFLSMKDKLDKASPYCYPLLQWIITSNRSHIVQLPEGKQIQSMVTKHQYLLLSSPPEKEELFRKLKKAHGSTFAFHGSSIENWHSILRKGLINASGTKFQVNGAAYGSGIYLSPHAATSFGYSRIYNNAAASKQGNRFLNSDNVNCIAICEVIKKDIKHNGSIWVQPDPDCVVTRFFCVYTSAVGTATNCNTEDQNFTKEIQAAIDYFQGSRQ
jgi:poly [ADP-ribose] polymerase 6/8